MAHKAQLEFCNQVRQCHPHAFNYRRVLDCGSLDVNGNNRWLFNNCEYIGVDVAKGKNVDVESVIHNLKYKDETFDTIISTESLEHDKYYKKSLQAIIRMLRPGGLFLFTCATTGRKEHGTARTTPQDSLISRIKGWQNYYKNIEIRDIIDTIDMDIFTRYSFSVNNNDKDLYFWGVKTKNKTIKK